MSNGEIKIQCNIIYFSLFFSFELLSSALLWKVYNTISKCIKQIFIYFIYLFILLHCYIPLIGIEISSVFWVSKERVFKTKKYF